MKKYLLPTIFIVSLFLLSPCLSRATTLQLDFDKAAFNANGEAIIQLKLSPSEEKINALGGELVIVSGDASFKEIVSGNSIVSAWLESPLINGKKISFSGIIPGGFSGVLSPFSKDLQAGTVMTVALFIEKPGKIIVALQNAELYAGNGEAQSINLEPRQLELEALKSNIGQTIEIIEDKTAPVDLLLQIIKIPGSGEDLFAVFTAIDLGSGIDRYEIQESDSKTLDPSKWESAQSPYRLKYQDRRHFIFLKAIDRQGQESIAVLEPAPLKITPWYIIVCGALLLFAIIYGLYNGWRRI